MTDNNLFYSEIFKGLKALAEASFPKKCTNCGRLFETADQFLFETRDINTSVTGLKQSEDEDGTKLVEAFRNCPCGSTLMDFFSDRRSLSEESTTIRKRFDKFLRLLEESGLDRKIARLELIKMMRGEKE